MDLDKQILAMLADDENVTASDAAALVEQVESAIAAAEAQLEDAHTKKLDLEIDPHNASTAITTAEIVLSRLNASLQKLNVLHKTAAQREYAAAWQLEADAAKDQGDALTAEFIEVYPSAVNQLVDLFIRHQQYDRKVDKLNSAAPGLATRLAHTNTAALIAKVQLPIDSIRVAWPQTWALNDWVGKYVSGLSASGAFAAPDAGPDWQNYQAAKREASLAENKKMVDYHQKQQVEYEARQKQEAKAAREARRA